MWLGACLCSHSPMFPQSNVPTALYSHSPMFPHFEELFQNKVLCSHISNIHYKMRAYLPTVHLTLTYNPSPRVGPRFFSKWRFLYFFFCNMNMQIDCIIVEELIIYF